MEKLSDTAIEAELCTRFEFQDFREAFTVMTRIAFECEAQGHHPDWTNVYNRLDIKLHTHDAGGLTRKDFALARTIEALVTAMSVITTFVAS